MKFLSREILSIVLIITALVLGLVIGRKTSPASALEVGPEGSFVRSTSESSRRNSNSLPSSISSKASKSQSRKVTPSGTAPEQVMADLAEILNTSNRISRTRQLLGFLDGLGPTEIQEVFESFKEAGWVDQNRGEFSMLITAWMDSAPHAAISYLDENEEDGWARKTAVSAWASEDPSAAAAAIEGLEDGGEVNDWVVGLIQGMARNDPNEALQTLLSYPEGDTRRHALKGMLSEVATRGSEFAGEWFEQIDDPKLQRDSAKQLAHSLANRDPEIASDWVNKVSNSQARIEASAIISEIYAKQDLQGARQWVEELPADALPRAAEGIAKHLAQDDPGEAALWLANLGNGPDLDKARIQFLRVAGREDPETALQSVPRLTREKDQEKYYREILGRWKKEDQEAAIVWAERNSANLSEKVLKSVLPKERRPM